MQRPVALLVLALLALPALATLAHAATITPAEAQELKNLVAYANTTYTIAAVNDSIVITNTNPNNTLLLVFNPALRLSLFNVSGAHALLVNISDYSIVEDILGNATSYDVVGYGGEAPGLALALVIPANSTATIGWVYYAAPEASEAESLSAIAPPEGFKLVGDYYGTTSKTWSFTAEEPEVIWVAFYQGDVDGVANPSDLFIAVINNNMMSGQLPLKLDPGNIKFTLYGKNGGYETKIFSVTGGSTVTFEVKTYAASGWKTAWRVIYAAKSLAEPKPEPKPEQTTSTHTPDAKIPSSLDAKDAKLAAAAAAGFFIVLLLGMAVMRR